MIKRRWMGIGAGVLAVALVAVLLLAVRGSAVPVPPGALGDVYGDSAVPVYLGGEPAGSPDQPVGENDRLALYYDPQTPAIRILDKRNGFVWSSAFDPANYSQEADDSLRQGLSVFCQIVYTDFDAVTSMANSNDEGVQVTAERLENGVCLTFDFQDYGIRLPVEVWLDGGSLIVRVPQEKLVEGGDYALLSVDLLPLLGASSNGEDGYMVYPDGCGAIYRYKEQIADIPAQMYEDIYSPMLLDYDDVTSAAGRGEKNILLPAFGVVKGENALAGYVCQGDDSGYIRLQPSGYGYLINRLNAGITYRKTYKFQTPDGSEEFDIERQRRTGDLTVRYFFLQGDEASYSGMASAVRGYLLDSGRLAESPLTQGGHVPIYTELFIGAKEKTMLWENEVTVTDFAACRNILEDLRTDGETAIIANLLGWQKEGYGRYPAHGSPSAGAGGSSGLKSLREYADESGIRLLLSENFTRGYEGSGGFSKQNEAVYSVNSLPVSSKNGDRFFLNAYRQLLKLRETLLPQYQKWGSGLAIEDAGRLVYDDYSKTGNMTREDTMAASAAMLEETKKQLGFVAVQNGNAYTLANADFLFDVPDSASGNPLFDEAIPFYQMVLHGSIPYASHTAANMSYDVRGQQLRWAEFGSVPYYLLTDQDPVALKDSEVTTVFSSRYAEMKEDVKAGVAEYTRKMAGLWNQEIREHRILDGSLRRVTYRDGSRVYVNYGEEEKQADGVTIPPRDYVVCLADGTQR